MSRILSAVQPTGNLHLGNYLGAIVNWVKIQKDYDESLFCVVDLHAITVEQNPESLRENTLSTVATYIACGIDPEKSAIFHQSSVSAHCELAWILGTMTPLGWLNRMTQFKEKAGKNKEKSGLGLYSYPVLMAADILLYQADAVPVGEDQKQHLELARDIAGAFNRRYDQEYFTLPEPLIQKQAARVMSLRDGTKKMSKSDPSDMSRIHLTDSDELIEKKIKKAKSDVLEGLSYDVEARPEASNLIDIYATISGVSREKVVEEFMGAGFSEFKTKLSGSLKEHIGPIRDRYEALMQDEDYLRDIVASGRKRAALVADKTMAEVKEIVGFLAI